MRASSNLTIKMTINTIVAVLVLIIAGMGAYGFLSAKSGNDMMADITAVPTFLTEQ